MTDEEIEAMATYFSYLVLNPDNKALLGFSLNDLKKLKFYMDVNDLSIESIVKKEIGK